MTKAPRWKPEGYPSISPYLICADAERLIAFLHRVFDAALLRRFDRPDGTLMHAEMRLDDSVVMIGGGATAAQAAGPHLHVYVADVDAVFARALAAGAVTVQSPLRKDAQDDYRGGFSDGLGNTWWIASQG